MSHRVVIAIVGLMMVLMSAITLEAQTKPSVPKQYAPPKTLWGDPDLQGTWTSTNAELTAREATIARQAENDKQQFVAPTAQAVVNPPGHWGERARRPCRQTSLVIEPANGGTPTSDALKLTEKFTRVDATTINYEVTVDDPKTYAKPWKVAFPITQEPGYENFEYACHEGNNAMFNSLSGARALEKAAQTK